MWQMARWFTTLVFVLVPALALAQPPRSSESLPEKVTVTGTKSREVLKKFVGSLAAPTHLTGKMTRWKDGVCPITVGLRPQAAQFINRRLKEVAAQVGAPVNASTNCRPNIEILFTTTPQALMDNVRNKRPIFLGYYDSQDQKKQLAIVTHFIQSWYITGTRDVQGGFQLDGARPAGLINEMEFPCDICPAGKIILHPDRVMTVTGNRLGDGLRSELYNVVIVADSTKLLNYEIGELSDYIAMLALTQIGSQDTCQELPSIVNLLAEGCERKSNALTENDMAYLKGLYRMGTDQNLNVQKDQVAYQMEQ